MLGCGLIKVFSVAAILFPARFLHHAPELGDVTVRDRIRELVYRAEVYQESQASLDGLRALLRDDPDVALRQRIVRALSIVKRPLPHPFPTGHVFDEHGPVQAVVGRGHEVWLLQEGTWLELGDWLGDYFILDIYPQRLLLERFDGFRREVFLEIEEVLSREETNLAVFCDADIREVLSFISKRVGLNSFIPSGIDRRISGSFPLGDWLSLLDHLCRESAITWTRRHDNVIFSRRDNHYRAETIKSVSRKNEDLSAFLQNLAMAFDMELVLDEGLGDIKVDIHLQEQPWDEVLDCLSIMNGFTWFLIGEGSERPRLFIQKE